MSISRSETRPGLSAFYTEKLGFEVATDAPLGPGIRWIELTIPGRAPSSPSSRPRPRNSDRHLHRDRLRGQRHRATYAEMVDKGVEFSNPRRKSPGAPARSSRIPKATPSCWGAMTARVALPNGSSGRASSQFDRLGLIRQFLRPLVAVPANRRNRVSKRLRPPGRPEGESDRSWTSRISPCKLSPTFRPGGVEATSWKRGPDFPSWITPSLSLTLTHSGP